MTGIDVAPLPSASEYDCPNALLYTAEQEPKVPNLLGLGDERGELTKLKCIFSFVFFEKVMKVTLMCLEMCWGPGVFAFIAGDLGQSSRGRECFWRGRSRQKAREEAIHGDRAMKKTLVVQGDFNKPLKGSLLNNQYNGK